MILVVSLFVVGAEAVVHVQLFIIVIIIITIISLYYTD